MTATLIIISLSLELNIWGGWYIQDTVTKRELATLEECAAMKHQIEFLPPVGATVAQTVFCVENGDE